MGEKFSPIIIIVLIIALVIIGGLIIGILTPKESKEDNKVIEEIVKEEPIITLNKDVNEENDSIVIITVYASTESGEEIQEIILPNGVAVPGDNATYTATENGVYKFSARTISGGTSTSEIEVTEIPEISATNPYVPEGFSIVNENVEEGFVIEDAYGNQFVWVPVETGKLMRKTTYDVNYEETSGTATALVNSVAKYYGYYVGRFEASQYERNGEVAAASMSGKVPWTNVTYLNAAEHAGNSERVFEYTDCHTGILSSHAWDTLLEWIDLEKENYSSDVSFGNYTGTIYPTGITTSDQVRNIYDLAGNVREWTSEIYKVQNESAKDQNGAYVTQRVVRGGSANLKRTPASHIPYPENTSDNYWGFRLVLYK